MGTRMLDQLRTMQGATNGVGDVRGRGAMVAIEFVDDEGRPDANRAKAIASACHREGVLVLTAGTSGNVVRLLPPLVIDDDLLDEGLEILAAAVKNELA